MSARDGKVCINCRFWEDGICHYDAPHPSHYWPRTRANDWCGKWEIEAYAVRREREAAQTTPDVGDLA